MLIGIDLGTTNSAVAAWIDGKATLIPNSLGDFLTPSAVSIAESGEVLVGLPARERQPHFPDRTATAFKRLMGTATTLTLGKKTFQPEELSAFVLGSLKRDAEDFLGAEVDEAIITVPAYFNDKQRKATQKAAQMAGLKVDRLLNEPTAAALAYGVHELDQEEPFLVFDLGGGTFDVSIVEIFDNIIEVRSSAGDPRLGGIDFNEALAGLAMKKLSTALGPDARDAELIPIVREAAERTRRALTDKTSAPFRCVWKGDAHEVEIGQDEFEEAVAPLIDRLREPVLRSLRDIGLRSEQLREIILVGGATRMPAVRKAVTRLFGRFPNHALDPDQAIALGAAVMAGLKSRDAALEEIRMTDVCPFTLGINVAERDQYGRVHTGIFAPIIERNRTIPTSKVEYFHTMEDNQREILVGVYQGEAREVSANVKLGELKVPVPTARAGEVHIECRFSYDVSGLLEVDIKVPKSGFSTQKIFGSEDLDTGELDKRREILSKLKIHPRDEAMNAATRARAERCYQSLVGDERDYVGKLILAFEAVLERQDPRAIEDTRQQIEERLNEIEGERYL